MDSVNYRGINIPLVQMGAISSDDLFEPREQELFDLYERLRGRYGRVLDVGANVGIHTIIMARLGWYVTAFEPDPWHYEILLDNVQRNHAAKHVSAVRCALSTEDGFAEFVRVIGNTTASHLAGAREFHGPIERIRVRKENCYTYFLSAHFAKIDVEGHEADLLCAVQPQHRCEFLVEIGTAENARRIYDHFRAMERPMWTQTGGWAAVAELKDVPTHYTHGALFIGAQP